MRRFGVVVIVGLLLGAVTPMHAQNVRCDGTLLELPVVEEGTSETDHFQFALRLEAQATSKKAALNELNRRLGKVRRKMFGLARGGLIVSAPHTYTVGNTTASSQRHQATFRITGEVSRSNYDPVIQQAGRLPASVFRG